MPRVTSISSKADLPAAYHDFFDRLLAGRQGPFGGPQSILLHSPEVSQRVSHLGNYLRFESSLKPPELELAIITVAREKDCSYIWGAHADAARKAGLSEDTVATIRERRDPAELNAEEAAIVTYIQQLLRKNRVDQAVFDRMLNRFGVRGLVELTALAGQYGLLAGVLNAFEVGAAPEVAQLPV